MFRFNVPGKGISLCNRVTIRKEFRKEMVLGKDLRKASYYIRNGSEIPPQDGWNVVGY